MSKSINYNTLKFLNNYDLLNKFNFKSIYEFPVHKNIKFKIFLKDNSLAKITQLQIKSFFLFYLLGLININLNLKYVTGLSRAVLIESNIQSNTLKQELFEFLFNFYLITNRFLRSFFLSENSLVYSKKSGKPVSKNFVIISYLPANLLIEKREQTLINFNVLKVFICFEVNQPVLYFTKNKINRNIDSVYFKNIFPFWALK